MNISKRSKILCFGEILWDVLPGEKTPGGAPMNVAVHLNRLGLDVRFVSRIGDDPLGHKLKQYLESIHFSDYLLQLDTGHPTGTAQVNTSDPNDPQYDFPDCAWDYLEFDHDLFSLAHASDIIVHGSLVARKPKSYDTLMQLIGDENKYKVFDVNLRDPHYSQGLIQQLLEKADLVKMNDSELQVISDWFFEPSDQATWMRQLRDRFHCQVISVTHGKEGASLLYEDNYLRHDGYLTSVVDSIGAGDAFLAGLLQGILMKEAPDRILANAVALGAYVTTRSGANPIYKKADIERFKNTLDSNSD